MRAVAQEELLQEKMLEEIKEEIKEELKEEKEEPKEEKEELKEEKEELKEEKEEKEKLQEQSDEKTEPQEESKKELPKGISLLMEEENSTAVSGKEAADFEGKGEENDPYLIEDVEDLKKLAENVKNGTDYEGKYFQLTVNIDLKNEEWTPIGTIVYTGEFGRSEERYFKGTFDGDGHQIANLTITGRNEYVGLFGYVRNATIQNCNVAGEVSGYNAVGGIVGAVDGKTNNILNCSFQGNVTGNVYVGGIVGQVQNQCEVSSCYAIGTVHGGNDKVGGIAGEGRGAIKNCYALADVSAGGKFVGGIAGDASSVTIENCYYSGEVSARGSAGGIVGGVGVKTKILNCSFQGSVMGESDCVGGIVGETSAECEVSGCFARGKVEGLQKVGGIAGKGVGTIKNCYALADVTARDRIAGGIAGGTYNLTIENCYYGGDVLAKNYAGGIAGVMDSTSGSSTTIKNCVSLAESVTAGINSVNRIAGGVRDNINLINNHSYNRTKLVIDSKPAYPTGGAGNDVIGADVYISNGRVMKDVQKGEVFAWTGFDKAIWYIPTEAGKLPSLQKGTYPDLPNLPSVDLTIDKTPQHFTTRNIGNGFVVKVTSEGTLNESIEFTKEYRLHDTTDAWKSAVPNTAGTYDVKITRAADGDINPFACEIPEGLVLTKKRSSSSGAATQTYTAQFDTNGGSAVDKVKTDKNGKIERPADPTKEGYIFVGWYSDSKLTKPFDFSAELTANSTLYAKWKENNEIILTIGSRKISVFGREIQNDVAPKIVNDRTMLPIRIVAESLGGTVTWNGELQRVTIQKGADVILITIGADTAYVNGTAVKLDAAAFVENGRTYLPLRFVSETLGAQVVWNEAEKTVTITK